MHRDILTHTVFFVSGCVLSHAAVAGSPFTVPLAYGINKVDFGPGTSAGMGVLAHRENVNAHGFDVLTMYVKPAQASDGAENWQIVSIFESDKESLNLNVGGGRTACCTIFACCASKGQVN